MARGPHQRSQIVAVDAPGIDARLEHAAHDLRKAARGRIGDRCLSGGIHGIDVGAAREELLDDAIVSLERGRSERGDT